MVKKQKQVQQSKPKPTPLPTEIIDINSVNSMPLDTSNSPQIGESLEFNSSSNDFNDIEPPIIDPVEVVDDELISTSIEEHDIITIPDVPISDSTHVEEDLLLSHDQPISDSTHLEEDLLLSRDQPLPPSEPNIIPSNPIVGNFTNSTSPSLLIQPSPLTDNLFLTDPTTSPPDIQDDDETLDLSLFQGKSLETATPVSPDSPSANTLATSADEVKLPPVPCLTLYRFATKFDFFLVFLGTLGSLLNGFMLPLSSLLLGEILNKMQDPSEFEQVVKDICFILFSFGVLSLIAGQFMNFCFVLSSERQGRALREAYIRALYRQDMAYFDTQSVDIAIKVTEFTATVQAGLADKLGSLISGISSFIFALSLAFSRGWELSLVLLAPLPILLAVVGFVMSRISKITVLEQKSYGKANTLAQETFDNIRTVKSYNMTAGLITKYQTMLSETYKFGVSGVFTKAIAFWTFLTLMFSMYALGIWYGGIRLIALEKRTFGPNSELYQGGLIIAIFYTLLSAMQSVGQSIPNVTAIAQARASMAELINVIDRKSEIDPLDFADDFALEQLHCSDNHKDTSHSTDSHGYTQLTENKTNFIFDPKKYNKTLVTRLNFTGSIKFENVSFAYPSRSQQMVLTNFSFTFEKNNNYGILGKSGSGKSTVLQLIQRFYDPTEGEVFIEIYDNINPAHPRANDFRPNENSPTKWVNLKNIYIGPWRKYVVGLVTQEPPLISGTIADNIRFGNPQASECDIIAAAKIAHAHDFIMQKEGHYNLFLQEGACSGGQMQRIAIARTLIMAPACLLLDEYTAPFDYKTEAIVSENIHSLFQPSLSPSSPPQQHQYQHQPSVGSQHVKTMITVAHRLVTIRRASVLLGMADGKLIEFGSPASLLQDPNSLYYSMYHAYQNVDPTLTDFLSPTSSTSPTPVSNTPTTLTPSSSESNSNLAPVDNKFQQFASNALRASLFHVKPSDYIRSTDQHLENQKRSQKVTRSTREFRFSPLIFHILFRHPFLLFLSLISIAISGASFPGFSYIFGHALKALYAPTVEELKKEVNFYAILFLGFALVAGTNTYCSTILFGLISEKVITYFREKLFSSIIKQEMGFFDQEGNNTGTLTAKLAKDTSQVRAFITQLLQPVLAFIAQVIISFGMSYHINPKMTYISCLIFPITVLSSYLHFSFVRGFAGRNKEHLENSGAIAVESLKNIRTIATFNAENWTFCAFSQLQDKALYIGMLNGLYGGFGFGLSQFMFYFASSCSYWFGGQLVINGELYFNEFFQIFQTMRFCSQQFSMLLSQVSNLDAMNAAIADMYDLIDRKSLQDAYIIDQSSHDAPNPIVAGKIEFRDVKFHYPTNRHHPVLKGISFSVEDVQYRKMQKNPNADHDSTLISICGVSGMGKSTLINLLLQFYVPIQPNGNDRLIIAKKTEYYNKYIRPKFLQMMRQDEEIQSLIRANNTKDGKKSYNEKDNMTTSLLGGADLDDSTTSFLSTSHHNNIQHTNINDANNTDVVISMPTDNFNPSKKTGKKLEDMTQDERYLYMKEKSYDFEHGGDLRNPDESGQIFIDGHDLSTIPSHKLYEKIGYVSQSPQIFKETVLYNIRSGDETIPLEKAIDCAKKAEIHDVIMKLPQGYETIIDSKKFSTGQKQRIRIAASLCRDPIILVIDEGFSGLDNINSRKVNIALQAAMKGKITLSIAHRLETIQHADEILVIDQGHISERGTHQELLDMSQQRVARGEPEGLYAGLIASTIE